jgi:ribosome-associated protein
MARERLVRINRSVAIPMAELRFAFTRSSGPGGQHVNKASTQVELAFDVAGSPSLTEEEKTRIAGKLGGYMSKEGVLRLTCQTTRSQRQNRAEVVERFQELLRQTLAKPKKRKPTRPTKASVERRLAAKKQRSALKRQRRTPPDDHS